MSLIALLVLGVACVPPASTSDDVPRTPAQPAAEGLTEDTATYLAALPLACLDRPQGAPSGTGYLYERSVSLRMDYESTRAFYGCYDWHSAVNSTWTLVEILERFPESRIAPLIVEKLDQHLTVESIAGEIEHFANNPSFERPYGWAWFLGLDAALQRSSHPKAAGWAAAVAPLSEIFVGEFVPYLDNLDYPIRVGTHNNTAFALDLVLGYADQSNNADLVEAVRATALRLFANDASCPLAFEPSGSDFLSPCLEAAKLMAAMPLFDFPTWIDAYLGPLDGPGFTRLAAPIQLRADNDDLDTGELGAKSHLIGLAFTRAEALERIAAGLPADDPRAAAFRRVASEQAAQGFAAMFEADYLGSHWLATFALNYLIANS